MQYNEVRLSQTFIEDFERLLFDYYEMTDASDGIPPYDFNWQAYIAMEDAGRVLIVQARDGIVLCGAVIYMIVPHPHHRQLLVAECDSLSVDYNCRGQGVGSTLMRVAEPLLRERGVKRVSHRYRVVYDTTPLFPKLGYKLEEQCFTKELH